MVLKQMLKLSLVLTFLVILLGAYTRLADAGLGCPDWPGCYGQLSVPSDHTELASAQRLFPGMEIEQGKAWLEMIHRYFAGSLGVLVLAISVVAFITKSERSLSSLIVIVVVFQALLGMWTVTLKLMPLVVMGHLLGGFTLFSLLALMYWRLTTRASIHTADMPTTGLKLTAVFAFVAVIVQIALGGWTSSNYAALMCTELPICEGQWRDYLDFQTAFQWVQAPQPSYEFGTLDYGARMTIHIVHRFGAMVVSVLVLALIWQLLKQNQYRYRQQAVRLGFLLVVQVLLGISNVAFSLPLVIAVAHNLGAALLLLNVLYVNHLVWRLSPNHYAMRRLIR